MKKQIFIAEIKTQSPTGFRSPLGFYYLRDLAVKHGDWISVHTNGLWGGDFEAIPLVRAVTNKPILAKGLHSTDDDIQRALDKGADYVLVVGRYPADKYMDKCLIERHAQFEPLAGVKYVCNSRDVSTGDYYTYGEQMVLLDRCLDRGNWTCQASGISSHHCIDPRVDAFIVGENLPMYIKNIP